MSLLNDFYLIDEEIIRKYIEENKEENLHFEFKILNSSEFKNKDDKKNLAESVSGFANAMGGIIVWGIDCRTDPKTLIDGALAIRPIKDLKQALNRLIELTSQAASPIVDGVQHRMIELSENEGVLLTIVPESDSGPHMAKLGLDRYFKRCGASFLRMEHFEVQDMFGRRARPNLSPFLRVRKFDDLQQKIEILISNIGRGAAKHAGFMVRFEDATTVCQCSGEIRNVSHVNGGNQVFFYDGGANVFLQNGIQTYVGELLISNLDLKRGVYFSVTMYCEHMQTKIYQYNVREIYDNEFLIAAL